MRVTLLPVLAGLLLSGCTSVPFDRAEPVSMSALDARDVPALFAPWVPRDAEILESVSFQFFGREMAGLGYAATDLDAGMLVLSCMTLSGVELFDVRLTNGVTQTHLAIEVPGEADAVAEAIGTDVVRLHTDWTPSASAEVKRGRQTIRYTDRSETGRTEYVYGGAGRYLIEKRYYEGSRLRTRVRYFDYAMADCSVYPRGMVLENKGYRYRLVVRVKSVHDFACDGVAEED